MKIWSSIILLLFFHQCFSQKLVLKPISVDDGLPSSEIYDILQDPDGFIWITSDNGLARYDGHQFKIYTSENGLSDNCVINVLNGVNGEKWIKTIDGNISYVKNDSIIHYEYKISQLNANLRTPEIPGIAGIDKYGHKWMVDEKNYYLFKEKEKNVFEMVHYDSISGPNVYYIIKTFQDGQTTHSSYYSDDRLNDYTIEKTSNFLILGIPKELIFNSNFKFYLLSDHKYIGIDAKGNYVLFTDSEILEKGQLNISNVGTLLEDSYKNLWISTDKGVYLFSNGDLTVSPHLFFQGQHILKVLEDKEGVFWFVNHNEGIFICLSIHFNLLDFSENAENKNIVSLKVRNNKLWFSTKKGEIWQVDNTLNSQLKYRERKRAYDFYPFEVLSDNSLFLPGGFIYTPSKKIIGNTGKASDYRSYKSISYSDDGMFIGTSMGVQKVTFNDNYELNIEPLFNKSLNKRTNDILIENDRIWTGSVQGLSILESDTIHNLSTVNPILSNRILSLKLYKEEHLVIGTRGAGVLMYQKNNHHVKQISTKDGLISNMVKSVFVKGNNIYVGTNKGLSIIHLDDQLNLIDIRNFDTQNALPSNEVNDITYYNDKIWLGTHKGLVYFEESKLKKMNVAPVVYINHVLVGDSTFRPVDTTTVLPKYERDIIFHFTDISFKAKNKISYKYYLNGADQDTLFTGIAKASFTNLKPGDYTFYVWAKGENGIWSKIPAKFSFDIPKKITEKLWFKLCVIIVFIFTVLFIIYRFYRKAKIKQAIDLQTVNLKQQALSALMNPHFIHNSLAAIQHFINKRDYDKSSKYLTQFSSLVRLNLNAIHEGSIILEDEIERLELYLAIEKMRFGDKLNYRIEIDDDIDTFDIKIPSMLLQPFVENALRHGILPLDRPGNIVVRFKLFSDMFLEAFIEDDGVGINNNNPSKEEHYNSISVNLTKERLALFSKQSSNNYQIKISEANPEKGNGTIVYLKVPIME